MAESTEKRGSQEMRYYRMHENQHGEFPFFIRKYTLNCGEDTSYHCHEFLQINYVSRGTGQHGIREGKFKICKGDIFVIPPSVPHAIAADVGEDVELYEFEFLPTFINESFGTFQNVDSFLDFAYIEPFLVAENKVKPRLNLSGELQAEVEKILWEALKEFEQRPNGFELMVKSLLLKLLVLVGRAFTVDLNDQEEIAVYHRHREDIYGALRYIEEHYHEDLNASEIAKRFALSPSYFRYLFKSITMKTFVEYLNNIRIMKACELLCSSDQKVLDIGLDTGFHNIKHFNEVFRQITGMTPLQYRKHNQNSGKQAIHAEAGKPAETFRIWL